MFEQSINKISQFKKTLPSIRFTHMQTNKIVSKVQLNSVRQRKWALTQCPKTQSHPAMSSIMLIIFFREYENYKLIARAQFLSYRLLGYK